MTSPTLLIDARMAWS